MTQTLEQLISAVQAQLIDDGSRFNTATCTAAIRSALATINQRIPQRAAEIVTSAADTREYEITDALFVYDVLEDEQNGDDYTPLEFDAYTEDNRAFFKLRALPSANTNLLTRYARAHTISGLDSAADSTLTANQDQVLIDGACFKALSYRGVSRVEPFNLNNDVERSYREAMNAFASAFEGGLRYYEARSMPPSENRQTRWVEQHEGWDA